MGPPTLLQERRVAGSLLVTGFAILVVAAVLYGDGAYPAGHAWQSNALTVGLVLTLLGLTAFQVVLTGSGDRQLARLGTIAYLVGVVLWIVDDALDLAGGQFIFELERDYVVLACLAIGAFGGAILRTQILPRWLGAMAVAWALVWAVLYLVRMGKAPLGPNLIPAIFGLELFIHRFDTGPRRALLAWLPRTARDAAGGANEDGPPSSVNPAGAWPRPGLPVRQSPAPQA